MASEVAEDEARLIVRGRKARSKPAHSSDKMLFLFPVWLRSNGGSGGGGADCSLITSAISVVPANPPITALFSLGLIQAQLLVFLSLHNTLPYNSSLRVTLYIVCVGTCLCTGTVRAQDRKHFINISATFTWNLMKNIKDVNAVQLPQLHSAVCMCEN